MDRPSARSSNADRISSLDAALPSLVYVSFLSSSVELEGVWSECPVSEQSPLMDV